MLEINFIAVIASGFFAVILGALWYGPLFGKPWMAMVGITPESMKSMSLSPIVAMLGGLAGALVTAFVLSHYLALAESMTSVSGIELALTSAFWIWLGFYVPVTAGSLLWEGKTWKLFALNASYYLVVLLVNSCIIVFWK
jgi:hypothetical protein